MDAASSIPFRESGHEEWRALRGLEGGRGTQVYAVLWVFLFRDGEDVDIVRFHEFFLDTRGC